MKKITRMKHYLRKMYGIETLRVELPTEEADGAIYVSNAVHIQVPTYGGSFNVVQQINETTLKFFPDRRYWSELVTDIRTALRDAA